MADKTITQLDTITPASADEVPIWDKSIGITGKASLEQMASITSLSIMAISTTMTGRPLATNTSIKVTFTADITGADTSTPLSITYNGQTYNVKVGKHGILSSVYAHELSSGVYKYIQAWTTLELVYDGTQFIIVGKPIVLSSSDYTIYADGSIGDDPIGIIKPYYSANIPLGYLACDGSSFDTTIYSDLYTLLGTNTTPDLRECVLVGIGTNSTDVISSHDTYTLGYFKDDQFQDHSHYISVYNNVQNNTATNGVIPSYNVGETEGLSRNPFATSIGVGRKGDTTHGKQKGVNYIIKAL